MKTKKYLQTVKAFLTRNHSSEVVSIVLFGSLAEKKRNVDHSTDVDLLIILKDSCLKPKLKQIQQELLTLESHFFPVENSFFDLFKKGLQKATGMFINLFICSQSDFKDEKFTNVFGVNPLMAFLFAPKTSVWKSLKQRHKIIWGENLFCENTEESTVSPSDILRSMTMNLLLSLGAICLSLFTTSMTKYSMEAVKWSLFTWKNTTNYQHTSLLSISNRYAHSATYHEKRVLSAFLTFRNTREPSSYLLLFAPLFIFRLHYRLMRGVSTERRI